MNKDDLSADLSVTKQSAADISATDLGKVDQPPVESVKTASILKFTPKDMVVPIAAYWAVVDGKGQLVDAGTMDAGQITSGSGDVSLFDTFDELTQFCADLGGKVPDRDPRDITAVADDAVLYADVEQLDTAVILSIDGINHDA